jgi:hypothetical protein
MLNLAKTEADKMDRNPGTFSVRNDIEEVCAAAGPASTRSLPRRVSEVMARKSNESAE